MTRIRGESGTAGDCLTSIDRSLCGMMVETAIYPSSPLLRVHTIVPVARVLESEE